MKADWSDYFDAVKAMPPRETLIRAVDLFGPGPARGERVGIDLGCGSGRDTLELLRRGWRVVALDSSAEGLRRLAEATPSEARNRLTTLAMRYQDDWLSRLAGPADLVNASFSIPHCREVEFPAIWRQVTGALRAGGRFAGQLFGPMDEWARSDAEGGIERVFHDRAAVLALLEGFEIEHHDEVNRPGKDAFGNPKHWHVHHLVARKR